MTQNIHKDIIKSLPPGLTLAKAAKLLRYSQSSVRRWMEATGYEWAENEKPLVPKWAMDIDWRMTNSDIARCLDCSRERIRQIRNLLGKPKVENRGRARKKISTK